MKNRIRFSSFLAGAAAALLLSVGVTSALAASGALTYNAIHVTLDGRSVVAAGQELTLDSGAKVPSSILYTDVNGGGTTYLPLRKISEAVGAPLRWYGEEKTAALHTGCLAALMKLPLHCAGGSGAVFEGAMVEVEPILPEASTALAAAEQQKPAALELEVPADEARGGYISVTVTNRGELPVEFQLGRKGDMENNAKAYTASIVPARSTVTRTVQLLSGAKERVQSLYAFVGYEACPYGDCDSYPVDVAVTAVQFSQ